MDNDSDNLSKDALIKNRLGLHARSAAMIAEIAKNARSNVWLVRDGDAVDAQSVIDMLALGCSKGTHLKIKVDSKSDIDILNKITQLIEKGFGEMEKNE